MHAVQETIYFSKESTEDKTLVGSLSLPLLGPQRIASRVRENPTRMKMKEQREEITACSFHHNLGNMFIWGARDIYFIWIVETRCHTSLSSGECPVQGFFCILCDSRSCSPIRTHSLLLAGLSYIVLDLVLTVTAAIHCSKEFRRVM